jgi:hypothetical protein
VRGIRPHELADNGEQERFVSLWIAVSAALRAVLEEVSIADLAAGALPAAVAALAAVEVSGQKTSVKRSSIARQERAAVVASYLSAGLPIASTAGLVKLWTWPP